MRALATAICTLLIATGAAQAQDTARPRLLTRPDANALMDAFPPVALLRGISGRAVLDCRVAANGDASCVAVEENPADRGFGAAAEALAREWRFSPATENGQQVNSQIRLPIVFDNASEIASTIALLPVPALPPAYFQTPELARYYPESARAADVDGAALLACVRKSDGALKCEVESEIPEGYGFAERAIALLQENPAQRARYSQSFRVNAAFYAGDRPMPFYERLPTGRTFARHYPPRALRTGVQGVAIPVCEIQADRTVQCTEGASGPDGYGFGAAAANIANDFIVSEAWFGRPGFTVGDRIETQVTFRLSN
jgi:TonB family protein